MRERKILFKKNLGSDYSDPENKKSWRRPTLARPGDALPSAMEPLTSVFGMGTGMTAPSWSPEKRGKSEGEREMRLKIRDASRLRVKQEFEV